jgi:putative SOS response-associated peptidase YedK
MPAILRPDQLDLWLDCSSGSSTLAASLLAPAPDELLEVIEVDRRVSNVRNEGPEVQTPVRTRLL